MDFFLIHKGYVSPNVDACIAYACSECGQDECVFAATVRLLAKSSLSSHRKGYSAERLAKVGVLAFGERSLVGLPLPKVSVYAPPPYSVYNNISAVVQSFATTEPTTACVGDLKAD